MCVSTLDPIFDSDGIGYIYILLYPSLLFISSAVRYSFERQNN